MSAAGSDNVDIGMISLSIDVNTSNRSLRSDTQDSSTSAMSNNPSPSSSSAAVGGESAAGHEKMFSNVMRRFSTGSGDIQTGFRSPKNSLSLRRSSLQAGESQGTLGMSSLPIPKNDVSDELERLRVEDIAVDFDSAAQRALAALSGDAPPRAAGADSSEKEEPRDRSDKSGAGDGAEVIERIENRDTRRKQVIGRKIQQGDAQYALTYGMMLGIRVLTGRKEMYHSSHDSSDTFELTDDDFLWNMSLEFPPEGTTIDLSPGKRASNKFKVMLEPTSLLKPSSSMKLVTTSENYVVTTPPHKLKYPFKFKDYMPRVFRAVRSMSGISESDYMQSIAGNFSYIEFIANSKSGQFFFYSYDGKYMIKTQTMEEAKLLRRMMPDYVKHLHSNKDSFMCRFLGMHRVKMNFLKEKIHFIIMLSVFDMQSHLSTIYDLKGSTRGRITPEKECREGAVQKDMNLVNSHRRFKFGNEGSALFKRVITEDVRFLQRLNVMDYSLLVGVHEAGLEGVDVNSSFRLHSDSSFRGSPEKGSGRDSPAEWDELESASDNGSPVQSSNKAVSIFRQTHGGLISSDGKEVYFMGIIDILQLYNTRKHAETLLKSVFVRRQELSAVDAITYGDRFIRFMVDHTDYRDFHSADERLDAPPSPPDSSISGWAFAK